jgi:plasmid stability protein
MPDDAFADLESAREAVLAESRRFVQELEPALRETLTSGFDRLRVEQAAHVRGMEEATRAALEAAVDRAVEVGVAAVIERLRSPEIWLAPLTAPHLVSQRETGWPGWVPEWLARAFGGGAERPELGDLDDPSNRIWVAISSAARPMDPVLEEFGFEPGRPRLGGGRFGIQPRSLPQLDPSGVLRRRWGRYRAAFGRLSALAASED